MFAVFIFFGCQKAEKSNTVYEQTTKPEPSKTSTPPSVGVDKIDVPKLAGKTPEELDKIFGSSEKINPATIAKEKPGEYRLYKIEGNPKGLSVLFYKAKAVRFNLILEKPSDSAKEALLKIFNIEVKTFRRPSKKTNRFRRNGKANTAASDLRPFMPKRINPTGSS